MMPLPDPGCAIRPDGSLKDASEIDWHFDKDDDAPITMAEKSPMSGPPGSSHILHPYFLGHASPAVQVAGSRRSSCASRPSNHVVDPDNAMNSAAETSSTQKVGTGKRKAPIHKSARCVIQKTIHISGDSNDDRSGSEGPTSSPPAHGKATDVEEIEDANAVSGQEYASLKAMADADHEVSAASTSNIVHFTHVIMSKAIHAKSKSGATADVCTVFYRDKEHKNPDTAKVWDRHWCKICL